MSAELLKRRATRPAADWARTLTSDRVSLLRAIARAEVIYYRDPVLVRRDRGPDFEPQISRWKTVTAETHWLIERSLAEIGPEVEPVPGSRRLMQLTQKGADVVARRNAEAEK